MTYCISDIHGCYSEFMALLEKINFSAEDILYILGDMIDRGPDSIKCLQHVMNAPNMHMIMGNHEQMMIDALDNLDELDYAENWFYNGGDKVFAEFMAVGEDNQDAIIKHIVDLPYLREVKIGEQNYVLVHAGIDVSAVGSGSEISTAKVLPNQHIDDLLWIREKFYRKKALPRSITIFGHTATRSIQRGNGSKIWRDKRFGDKIGIDGGCVYGGNLLALRLDDMEEFAIKKRG